MSVQDLFAATYTPASYLVPGMLAGRPPVFGYAMQFNSAMVIHSLYLIAKFISFVNISLICNLGQSGTSVIKQY